MGKFDVSYTVQSVLNESNIGPVAQHICENIWVNRPDYEKRYPRSMLNVCTVHLTVSKSWGGWYNFYDRVDFHFNMDDAREETSRYTDGVVLFIDLAALQEISSEWNSVDPGTEEMGCMLLAYSQSGRTVFPAAKMGEPESSRLDHVFANIAKFWGATPNRSK